MSRRLGAHERKARDRARRVTNWLILLFVAMFVFAFVRMVVWPVVAPMVLRP